MLASFKQPQKKSRKCRWTILVSLIIILGLTGGLTYYFDPFKWKDQQVPLRNMLKTKPKVGVEESAIWDAMYPMNITVFEYYWAKANNITDS